MNRILTAANDFTTFALPDQAGPAIWVIIIACIGIALLCGTPAVMLTIGSRNYGRVTPKQNTVGLTACIVGFALIVIGGIGFSNSVDTGRQQTVINQAATHGVTIDDRNAATLLTGETVTIDQDGDLIDVDLKLADNGNTAGLTINGEPV